MRLAGADQHGMVAVGCPGLAASRVNMPRPAAKGLWTSQRPRDAADTFSWFIVQDLDDSRFFCDENVHEQRAHHLDSRTRASTPASSPPEGSLGQYGWRLSPVTELAEMIG